MEQSDMSNGNGKIDRASPSKMQDEQLRRVPPHSLDAEKSIFSAIFAKNSAYDDAALYVTADDFYPDAHRVIFRAIGEMLDKNKFVDAVTLADYLRRKKLLDDAGGEHYLQDLRDWFPDATHTTHYADIVRGYAKRRRWIELSRITFERSYDEAVDVEEIQSELEEAIYSVEDPVGSDKFGNMREIKEAWFERFEGQGSTPLRTGIENLDSIIGGFRNGNLIVIGARPSIGKTALALNFLLGWTKAQKKVLFFSLEQPRMELADRCMAILSQINFFQLQKNDLNDEQGQAVIEWADDLWNRLDSASVPDLCGITVSQMASRARHLKRRYGLDLLMVDYLTLAEPEEHKGINREQQISTISRRFKNLAKQLDIPVVVLAAISREAEKNAHKSFHARAPKLWHLRESGAIEQDADLVLLMHRNLVKTDKKGEPDPSECEIVVGKNRNGPLDTAHVIFSTDCFRFKSNASKPPEGARNAYESF
jgi:replicative DNA helicase